MHEEAAEAEVVPRKRVERAVERRELLSDARATLGYFLNPRRVLRDFCSPSCCVRTRLSERALILLVARRKLLR